MKKWLAALCLVAAPAAFAQLRRQMEAFMAEHIKVYTGVARRMGLAK